MLIQPVRDEFEAATGVIDSGPLYPCVTAEEIRSHLTSRYDFGSPILLEDAAEDVERMLRQWQVQVTHPRYFGLYNPSVTLSSVVADTLVATYNPQLASWRTSPAANEIERHTLAWFTRLFGLPSGSAATFTTGGAEANLSAVVTALASAFPGYGDEGLNGLPGRPAIYLSSEAHHSFYKIACMTGLGRSALRVVPVDSSLMMDPQQLVTRIETDRARGFFPLMVVGTAGTTAAGAIDPLPVLADICREKQMWFHVDAAWGGAAIVSPSLRCHLAGTESADSITCDAHKWLSVAMSCGMFFCRHPEAVRKAFSTYAGYMPSSVNPNTSDPYMTSVQWSRRFIGLKLFLSLAERGEDGQAKMIEHQAGMGHLLRQSLAAAGWRVVNKTPLPVVCFTRDGLDVPAFLQELRREQVAWMSETCVAGTPAVRACITSFKTTAEDIFDVVREITDLAENMGAPVENAACEMS